MIATDLRWLSANQLLSEIKAAAQLLTALPLKCVPSSRDAAPENFRRFFFSSPYIFFKGRRLWGKVIAAITTIFVLQARSEVGFMRRRRRHWEKQLMKTKPQFPDAFELPPVLIWLFLSMQCMLEPAATAAINITYHTNWLFSWEAHGGREKIEREPKKYWCRCDCSPMTSGIHQL